MKTVLYDNTDICNIARDEKERLINYFQENPEEIEQLKIESIADIANRNAWDFLGDCLENTEQILHDIFDDRIAVISYRSHGWNFNRAGYCINDFSQIYDSLKSVQGEPSYIEIDGNAVGLRFPNHDGGQFITVKVIDTDCDYWEENSKSPRIPEENKKFIFDFCTLPIPEDLYC